MTQSVNELISNKAVYRTAPAAPGLLISIGGDCRTAQATPGLLMTTILMMFLVPD